MVAEPAVWVDVEDAVRQWARDVLPDLGGRVFFGVNNKADPNQIKLARIAGSDEDCLIQFDVWANTKAQAADTAADLASQADLLASYRHNGVQLHGAQVVNVAWIPDPVSDRPRYVVDVTFSATAGPQPESS